jgi:hypothetical protein
MIPCAFEVSRRLETSFQKAATLGALVLWPITLLLTAFGCVVAFIWSMPRLVRKIANELVKELDDEEKP